MTHLELRFIGTGNAFAPGGLCWNGFVVNGKYLFETPPQALMSLNRMALDPNEMEAVVISHHHGDHFLGLPFLLLHWKHMGRRKPVRIVAPENSAVIMKAICDSTYPGVFEASYGIEWINAEVGRQIRVGGLQMEPTKAKHDPKLQSFGFKCELDGRRFGYTGDSAMCDGVLELARHSEVLVAECALRNQTFGIHMNLVDDMPRVRAAMAPEATLVMTHVDKDVDSGGLERTLVAKDLQTYVF